MGKPQSPAAPGDRFTGKKGSGTRRKQQLTRKQKLSKRRTSKDKYAHLKEQ